MLRLGAAILSPLRTRFDDPKPVSPRALNTPLYSSLGPPDQLYEIEPVEDHQQDARIELMRRATEHLKEAVEGQERLQLLNDVRLIMSEDAVTKDVFREMDGLLILMNILSSFRPPDGGVDSAGTTNDENIRLVFSILSQSIYAHAENRRSFETLVGHQGLHSTLETLIHSRSTSPSHIFDCLVAFAMNDFTPYGLFVGLDHAGTADPLAIDTTITNAEIRLSVLQNPAGIVCILQLLHLASPAVAHAALKMVERIGSASHRNQALLSQSGVSAILFEFARSSEYANPEMTIIYKTLKRLLEMGAPLDEARTMFHSALKVNKKDQYFYSLDSKVMDQLKGGMKAAGKWPDFVSIGRGDLERAGVELPHSQLQGKTFPGSAGFTYLAWVYVERLPGDAMELYLLKAEGDLAARTLCALRILPSGYLSYFTSTMREPLILEPLPPASESNGSIPAPLTFPLRRWVHISLIHHSSRSANNVRVFLDGMLYAAHQSPYPKSSPPPISFFIGNETRCSPVSSAPRSSSLSASTRLAGLFSGIQPATERRHERITTNGTSSRSSTGPIWFFASTHLILQSLPNSAPRLIYTLGHRYVGNFQDSLARFLTYRSCTSLNVAISQKAIPSPDDVAMLTKALRVGLGIQESRMAFSLSSCATSKDPERPGVIMLTNMARDNETRELADLVGEVRVMGLKTLDAAIWNVGGAAVLLRLVELASTDHDLVSALVVLSEGVNTSWQNSEDMERIHGYTALIAILRSKVHLITLEVFHTLLEFLGIDFTVPENSIIINPIAYRVIALDFSFWSLLPPPLQRLHLAHFQTILQTSRYRNFNAKFRFVKFGAVKKIIYVLQTHMYRDEMIPEVISALSCIARQSFSTDATIKPLISYLAANLEPQDLASAQAAMSPSSPVTAVEKSSTQERAEQVLEAFVDIISSDAHMKKFRSAMPAPRICLLLLGTHPGPVVAAHVLNLCALLLEKDPSFSRKFEIVSFWSALQDVLPPAWDPSVHVAAFDVLFGRAGGASPRLSVIPRVSCSHVLPAILSFLDYGLKRMVGPTGAHELLSPYSADSALSPKSTSDSYTEVLAEELIELHSISPSFRSLFQSKPITSLFIKACRTFVIKVAEADQLRARTVRISEKLTHLVLMLALDNAVDQHQKEELMEIMRISQHEAVTNIPLTDPNQSTTSLSRTLSLRGGLRLDITPALDRALHRTLDRTSAWRQLIVAAEKKRLRKAHQDHREYIRQMQRPEEWHDQLHSDHGLWPKPSELAHWRLDETEGPMRIRKKLQPELSKCYVGSDLRTGGNHDISASDADVQSMVQVEVPPWEQTYEYGSTNVDDDYRWGEDTPDDRNRRVRHELEPGDVVEDLQTVARIVGVDASPGLLIVGRSHIYMLDGLVQDEEGEIIDARDVPKNILSVPGTTLELDGKQCAQRWAIEQVSAFSKRTYLFRDVGLEIYFKDSRSILIVFSHKKDRQSIIARLHIIKMQGLGDMTPSHGTTRTPFISRVSARVSTAFQGIDEIMSAQRRWQTREISNYTYLSLINQASGRTPNDLTQYPVFPWVVQDYTSEQLNLDSPKTFRDLTKPVGALSDAKREAAQVRYTNLLQIDEPPFHYGTHFSSSMIVTHFLIRLSPFSHYFKVLQGGNWDLPDRLFTDVKRAWDSASADSPADVRELIPEWFSCPEFLLNLSRLDFGTQTASSQKIDSVGLPPWAKQDPYLFIDLHRKALESEYVSRNLPAWIDLIWGYKQRDTEAVNAFHPLSYEGAIDLDSISDGLEKEATAGIIHNFGQTPRKIFSAPHPPRFMDGPAALPLGVPFGIPEDSHLLLQSSRPVRVMPNAVAHLSIDPLTERVMSSSVHRRYVPQFPHEHVEWGFPDKSLRFFVDNKLAHVIESTPVTCCDFPDSDVLVAGLEDTTVCIWQLIRQDGPSLRLLHVMRGHTMPPSCIASSRAWSMIVTGSSDRSAVLWDLNRGRYIRAVTHDSPITSCAIQESSGCIATCSRDVIQVHTINAHLIASLELSSHENVRSLAFHEREWSPIPVLAAGCADGSIVLRTWNADSTMKGEKARWQFVPLRVLKCRKENGENPSVDALRFSSESLYHGDDKGNVYLWALPDH